METETELTSPSDCKPMAKESDSAAAVPAPTEERFWDYSSRRVIVHNVIKYVDSKTLMKTVNQWISAIKSKDPDNSTLSTMICERIKKPPNESWMVVTLNEDRMVQPFMDYINNNNITNKRGRKLVARLAEETSKDQSNKRKAINDVADDGTNQKSDRTTKRHRTEIVRRPLSEEEVKDKITPLWRLTEEEQRETKMQDMIRKCAFKIVQEIKARFRALSKESSRKIIKPYSWLEPKRTIEVDPIVSAPTPLRNKCEFTFGYRYLSGEGNIDNDTNDELPKVAAVGFMAAGWAGGVSRPHPCGNIPPEVCALVDVVDSFLADSPLPPYDSVVHRGFWRILQIRTSRRTRECMVIVTHSPPEGGVGEKDEPNVYATHFESEKERLVSVLIEAELPLPDQPPLKVTSIFFQEFDGVSSPKPDHPVQHLYGKTCLFERLGKCTFQISPGSFFQVNTEGAEILYRLAVDKIKERVTEPEKTLLFDVCCGTGTIGLTAMKEGVVGQVVGVDISGPAIDDARMNAELNGFGTKDVRGSTTRFVAARAEGVLAVEIGKAKRRNLKFIAIVDPAREGLHPEVVKTLRGNERIERLVYVSCNPTGSLVQDATLLCAPPTKRYSGRPFRIVSAAPVDMFPQTDHCELVMTFDRLQESEMN